MKESQKKKNVSELEAQSHAHVRKDKDAAPSSGEDLHKQPADAQLVNHFLTLLFSFSEEHDFCAYYFKMIRISESNLSKNHKVE